MEFEEISAVSDSERIAMPLLDVHTLILVSSLVLGAMGSLFLVQWWDDRSRGELPYWGGGFLLVVPGVTLLGARGTVSDGLSIGVANACILAAYGLLTTGVIRFTGRRPWPGVAIWGALIWGGLCLWPEFFHRFDIRSIILSTLCGLHCAVVAVLLHRQRRHEDLPSLGRTTVAIAVVAALLWARAASMTISPGQVDGADVLRSGRLVWLSLALLVMSVVVAHLMLSMSAERANLRHRRRAETDDLTGLFTRRAFLERAGERLAEAPARGTLMFFDIDRFKSINDSHGHGVGDAVLVGFARLVEERLAPGDLLARWGGEEFVLFLGDRDFVVGRRVAEEIRRDFAALVFGDAARPISATVSVGLAAPALAGPDLDRLVAWADAGVYAAKRAGRDRVEIAEPPSPVEKGA